MKKTSSILINLFMIIITGGTWLLILVPYLIWSNRKTKSKAPVVTRTGEPGTKF